MHLLDKILWRIKKRLRRFVPLIVVLGLLTGTVMVASMGSASAGIVPCGQPVLSAGSWLQGVGTGGVTVYSNAQDGQSYGDDNCMNADSYVNGVDAGGEYQCVELVNELYLTQGWITTHWYGNGSTLIYGQDSNGVDHGMPAGLTEEPQGSITSIVPGDVVTLNYSTFGHAGVVSAVTPISGSSEYSVTIVNQNAPEVYGYTTWNPSAGTLTSEYSGYTTQAVIHAAANTAMGEGGSGASASTGYETSFQDNDGNLEAYNYITGQRADIGLGMASGTSPSISPNASGGDEIAFQANTSHLWTYNLETGLDGDTGYTVYAGTSPSVTEVPSGYEVAFHGTDGDLEVYGNALSTDIGLGMASGTSPAISGDLIAFQDNDNHLETYNISTGQRGNIGLGMASGTSPAISPTASGGYEIAFQANTGELWTYGTQTGLNGDTGYAMASGTSPAVTEVSSGYETVFLGTDGNLGTYGNAGRGTTGLGMASGTSPSIATVSNGYEATFQDNSENLEVYGNALSTDIGLGMASGTNPTIG